MRISALLVALIVGAASTACARHAGLESGQVQPASGPATIDVNNQYDLPMSVYVSAQSLMPIKLGTVLPGTTEHFTVQDDLLRLGMLRIQAQPPGGGRIVDSGLLSVSAGETVDFYIGVDLVGSQALVH